MHRDDTYYKAMLARDPRFDGKFFVGVKTTGIYCRPICPAKPKRENVEFFHHHLEAERAGYRPCLRCRPESAPDSPAWIGTSAVVRRAIRVLHTRDTSDVLSGEFNEEQFATLFGVSARHLRRLFSDEIGKTPKQLAQENRLNIARKLIVETTLPITEIAFASGFASIRRFNDAFKERFKSPPRDIRRNKVAPKSGLTIALPYRPPFDFDGLLASYKRHSVGDLEWFEAGKMHRIIAMNGRCGQVTIANAPEQCSLLVSIDFPDTAVIHNILARVRSLFDLGSDPLIIANSLEAHPPLKALLRQYPGIRLPSGWDPFETAIGTILGQLVSVERGRRLVHDLVDLAGEDSGLVRDGKSIKLFPTPLAIMQADLGPLKTTGMRRETLRAFARAVHEREVTLAAAQDVEEFVAKIRRIKGIGAWTAAYMALKILRDTDSFPATDLVLAKALLSYSKETIEAMRPWRGYVAALLWRSSSEATVKNL